MSRKLTLLVDETSRGRAERKLKTRFEWQAPIELQPCCLSFWGMMQTFDTVKLVPLSPDSYVEIVFTPDVLKRKVGSQWRALQRVFVVGRLRQMLYLRAVDRCRFVSLRLRGCTAALVLRSFGIKTSGLTEAEGVFPELEKIILGHLHSGNTAELRAQITAKLIQKRNVWNPLVPAVRTVMRSGIRNQEHKQPTNGAMQSLSRRQIERRVRLASDTNRRSLERLERFQRARDLIYENPHISLAKLATVAGYSDQAHFSRDFKGFTGLTPLAFRRLIKDPRNDR